MLRSRELERIHGCRWGQGGIVGADYRHLHEPSFPRFITPAGSLIKAVNPSIRVHRLLGLRAFSRVGAGIAPLPGRQLGLGGRPFPLPPPARVSLPGPRAVTHVRAMTSPLAGTMNLSPTLADASWGILGGQLYQRALITGWKRLCRRGYGWDVFASGESRPTPES